MKTIPTIARTVLIPVAILLGTLGAQAIPAGDNLLAAKPARDITGQTTLAGYWLYSVYYPSCYYDYYWNGYQYIYRQYCGKS